MSKLLKFTSRELGDFTYPVYLEQEPIDGLYSYRIEGVNMPFEQDSSVTKVRYERVRIVLEDGRREVFYVSPEYKNVFYPLLDGVVNNEVESLSREIELLNWNLQDYDTLVESVYDTQNSFWARLKNVFIPVIY
jgi:hypothetical protein